MFSDAAARNRDTTGEGNPDRDLQRHVAIKVDSMNWKMYILGGAIACVAAVQPSVEIFDQSTIRGLAFAAGACAIIGGLSLRRRFRCYMDRQVQGIIGQYRR